MKWFLDWSTKLGYNKNLAYKAFQVRNQEAEIIILTSDELFHLYNLAYLQLKKVIEKNHGIKEDNLNNFFKPIGFQMDETLKTTLNEFGKTRGEIAHTSFQTQNPLDPLSERNNIRQIISALSLFDEELSLYEQSGALPRTPIITQWKKFTLIERLRILFTGKHNY